jgi:hypothetical protein
MNIETFVESASASAGGYNVDAGTHPVRSLLMS